MNTDLPDFILHCERLAAVARRLSEFGVSFYGHEYSEFGEWLVVAGTELERFEFRWQWRELLFIISESVDSEKGRDWQPIRTLNLGYPESIFALETFLHETFSAT